MSALEEPEWWKVARLMYSGDVGVPLIAKTLNKSDQSVRYVLFPKYRERQKKRIRSREGRVDYYRCTKRQQAREYAISKWREEGKIKPLHTYFRKYECL